MADTAIEWTDKVWNPTTGCTRVSEGCRNCYAFALHDQRHAAHKAGKKVPPQYARPFKELQLFRDRLGDPLSWRKPCRVFVNSMSDLFHKDIPDEFIDEVFAVMGVCEEEGRGHVFQVLTKRPERMRDYMQTRGHKAWNSSRLGTEAYPPRNVWLGVSVERQQEADERIPLLLETNAAVRFLSCEPLLGAVDLAASFHCGRCNPLVSQPHRLLGPDGIQWVIVGGESGSGARAFQIEWARDILRQCRDALVACFVKQLGSRPYTMPCRGTGRVYTMDEIEANGDAAHEAREELGRMLDSAEWLTLRDKKGGDPDEWPEDLRVREFPAVKE